MGFSHPEKSFPKSRRACLKNHNFVNYIKEEWERLHEIFSWLKE